MKDIGFDSRGFQARLKILMAPTSMYKFAEEIGVPYQNLQKYAKGAEPGADFLCRLMVKKYVNLYWLLLGKGPPFHQQAASLDEINRREIFRAILTELVPRKGNRKIWRAS